MKVEGERERRKWLIYNIGNKCEYLEKKIWLRINVKKVMRWLGYIRIEGNELVGISCRPLGRSIKRQSVAIWYGIPILFYFS